MKYIGSDTDREVFTTGVACNTILRFVPSSQTTNGLSHFMLAFCQISCYIWMFWILSVHLCFNEDKWWTFPWFKPSKFDFIKHLHNLAGRWPYHKFYILSFHLYESWNKRFEHSNYKITSSSFDISSDIQCIVKIYNFIMKKSICIIKPNAVYSQSSTSSNGILYEIYWVSHIAVALKVVLKYLPQWRG